MSEMPGGATPLQGGEGEGEELVPQEGAEGVAAQPAPGLSPGVPSSSENDMEAALAEQRSGRADATYQRLLAGARGREQQGGGQAAGQQPAGQRSGGQQSPSFRDDAPAWFRFSAELPVRSIMGGLRDAGQNVIEANWSFLQWLSKAPEPVRMAIGLIPGQSTTAGTVERMAQDPELQQSDPGALPDVPEPTTTAGDMTRGVVEWLGGMVGPYKAMTGSNALLRSTVAGGIADGLAWEPATGRLADLVREHTGLRDPVTAYLSSDADEGEMEGRFKNAVEGMLAGGMVDGLFRGLRVIKQGLRARGVKNAEEVLAPTVDDAALGGAPGGELFTAVDVDDALYQEARRRHESVEDLVTRRLTHAAEETGGTPPGTLLEINEGRAVYVNFARIAEPEDVQNVIQQMADLHEPGVRAAQRGVQSHQATQELADQLGVSVQDLLTRQAGEPWNAEKTFAARRLLNASAEKLTTLAERAAGANAGQVDVYNFRRAMAVHAAIQKEVIGARTETARALNSWRIPAGSGEERVRGIEAILDAHGGVSTSRELAKRINAAHRSGSLTPETLNNMARRGVWAKTMDSVMELWVMGLLSGPKTHIVNMMSNTSVIAQNIAERGAAGQLRALSGGEGVAVGEASHMVFGMLQGFQDLWRMSAKRLRGEQPGMLAPGLDADKLDQPFRGAITSEKYGLPADNWLGKLVDGIGALERTSGTALQVEDTIFKTLGYRMELHAQALRQATREGLEGPALKQRVAEIVADPPANIRMASVDQALYQTFTNKLDDVGRSLQRFINKAELGKVPVGRFLMPFVRTPYNIQKYSFARTPLAPLMSSFRADVAAGGARADLALTRMALGTATMLSVMDGVMSGYISGGGPPDEASQRALRRTGWQPYSVKIPGTDRWFSYQRTDPFASLMGIAADVAEFTQWSQDPDQPNGPEDAEELLAAAVASIGSNALNKNYMRGPAEFFEMMSDPDRHAGDWMRNYVGSAIPAAVAEVARQQDPYLKATNDLLDGAKARTPGWSESLPPVRDLWGRPVEFRSGLGWMYDMASPIYSKREDPEPIDTAILELGANIRKPDRRTTLVTPDGRSAMVDLGNWPEAYDRYIQLAGNELEHPVFGKGAKDALNDMVQGDNVLSLVYNMGTGGPDGSQAELIRDVISNYRQLAKQRVVEEFPELAAHVREQARKEMNRSMGMGQ